MRPAWLEIDPNAITHNCHVIQGLVGADVAIIAIVKCNGYGHGAVPVSQAAIKGGAKMLAVALLQEAIELRDAEITAPILLLGSTIPAEAVQYVEYDITPTITHIDTAKAISEIAVARQQIVPCQVKIDSGMGRQGVQIHEMEEFSHVLAQLPGLQVTGAFSHFSCAGSNQECNYEQLAQYKTACEILEKELGYSLAYQHLCASGGMICCPEAYLSAVRPGAILYGVETPGDNEGHPDTLPALSLKAKIVQLKDLQTGDPVGYGRTFIASRPTRIALLSVGYGDGYLRELGNKADVLVAGQRCPIVGRISMDCITVDVTDIPQAAVGDEVVLIGKQGNEEITAGELAIRAKTIVHEIMVCLTTRLPRICI